MKLMKKSNLPLYMVVRNQLMEDIERGKLRPNDSLPSERALSERLEVSRMTARQALIQLEREGLAYTKGRRSRFVSEPKVNYDLTKTISFFASASDPKNELRISVLNRETVAATDEQCRNLDLPTGSDVHFYSRLCRLGSRPSFIEEEYVSAARFPGLWEHDIAQPVLLLFERVYGVVPVRDRIVIRQSHFSPETSKFLEIEDPAIGMILEQTVFDDDDCPISFGCQYWRGDVARFSADIRY